MEFGTKQSYVPRIAEELQIPVRIVEHDEATSTCHEKAEILGWESDRIVKCTFFHQDYRTYGFVFPESAKPEETKYLDKRAVLPYLLGITKKQTRKYHNHTCPEGMEHGTCTPFVPEDSFGKGLERIFIHETGKSPIVDISIGGTEEEAHKTSAHLPYEGIYKILVKQFGEERIVRANLFPENPS